MNNNIFSPSFKFEKKTKALNIALWGFVGLISMFSVGLLIFAFHLMLCSILNIESTFISDNFLFEAFVIIFFSLMFGLGLYKFQNSLLHSYKFENNKIIKGRIINTSKIKDDNLILDTIATNYMVKNINNSKAVVSSNAAINIYNIAKLIELNTNQEFVNKFFDTSIYKKKTYNNPQLLKETKYSLIYICDNNKKLVIPKLYENMDIKVNGGNESSLLSRILVRSLIVFLIFFLFSMIDLFIGIHNNPKYMSNINNTCETIQANLNNYGYSITKNCNFEKVISNSKTSTIKYDIDKKGNITNVSLELYYDFSSYNDNELRYIISTMNTDFSNNQINNFINQVRACINGECTYGKIELGKNILRIGTSNSFINIHNY